MIDLLPPEGRHAVRKEYFLRILSTFSLLAVFVVVLIACAFIPTYVFTYYQNQAFALERNAGGSKTHEYAHIETALTDTMTTVAQLSATKNYTSLSTIVEEVESIAPSTISITSIAVSAPNGVFTSLRVEGTAETRESLAVFAEALESSVRFGEVEVPIADLARNRNLPFTLEVMARTQ